jgi:hypothetical protein
MFSEHVEWKLFSEWIHKHLLYIYMFTFNYLILNFLLYCKQGFRSYIIGQKINSNIIKIKLL